MTDIQAALPHVLVSLVALGMALAFIAADRESPTSRALAVAFAFIGISIDVNQVVPLMFDVSARLHGWFALPESAAMVALLEWVLRVRRTVPARDLDVRGGDALVRLGQAAGVVYGLLALVFPETRARDFLGALGAGDVLGRPGFWLFAVPVLLATVTGGMALLLLLNRRPDQPEKIRVVAVLLAMPFMAAGFVVPADYTPLTMIVGEMIFLVGAVQYHVLQGQRGQFMAQFLSPQVAEMVRQRGLKHAMQQNFLEISVVCTDLRGFTAVTEGTSSSRVIRVLREYYDAVGKVVSEYGGTIKDQAGDGILILLGAPLPVPDHAPRALAMARSIREVVAELSHRWQAEGIALGLGVGLATGQVTVGIIGARTRLEYTAVGAPVNLAARLCQHAHDGEILADRRTVTLCGDPCAPHWSARESMPLKGFAEPVPFFAAV